MVAMVLQWSSDGATANSDLMAESTADKFYPEQHPGISLTCRLSSMLHLFQGSRHGGHWSGLPPP